MDKSPEAFRTISEVADFLDTPAHVLRFWESRFPQIRPVKRAGGRRYYRPGDVALLAGIKKLLHDEGMTIRGVQKILREHGIRHVASLTSGDSGRPLDDADIEAVLSAEYGPRDRFDDDEAPSSEALQSAQIISLETALNRQDAAREPASGQAELWPPAPADTPATDAESWPDDPGDAVATHDVPETPLEIAADNAEPTDAPTEVATEVPAERDQESEQPLAEASLDSTETPEIVASAIRENAQVAAIDVVSDSIEDSGGESSTSAAADDADDGQSVETPTIAALLRRTSAADVRAVQPQLIQLRDRMIDLRGRVAEAARRKAK